jgi:hypothetical protein
MTENEDFEERLILKVSEYPTLYDVSSKNYHDIVRKKNIWSEIAEELDSTG